MNYQRIHDAIIERASNRTLQGYREKHHVIPRCMGGVNTADNLVELTAREHFIIHKLLVEIYPTESKLVYAYWAMCNKQSSKKMLRNYKISSRDYQYAKELFSILSSKLHKGKKSWNSGIKTGKSSWNLGIPHSAETKHKIGLKSKNRKHSAETRQKRSQALLGNIPWNKGVILGECKNKMTCPHCYLEGAGGSMIRWHFDNCKFKKLKNE
jgi:hypothetical protein